MSQGVVSLLFIGLEVIILLNASFILSKTRVKTAF